MRDRIASCLAMTGIGNTLIKRLDCFMPRNDGMYVNRHCEERSNPGYCTRAVCNTGGLPNLKLVEGL